MSDWKKIAITLATNTDLSWREIARVVGTPRTTVSDYLRKYVEFKEMAVKGSVEVVEDSEHDNSRILFLSDMHIPYHHQDTLPFLKMLKDRYNPTRVICLGDETDKHALSFHDSDPDLMSAGDELRAALPVIAELHDMFPQMDLVDSNHGSMVWR